MRAAVYDRYGPPEVVELRDVPKPAPRDNELLIRIRATTVSSGDWRGRTLAMPAGFGAMGRLFFGITGPRKPILGTELAGDVEAVGRDVRSYKVGDRVFAFPGSAMGCHAEYRCVAEGPDVAPIPDALSYEQAAALSFGGTTVLSYLRRARVQRGDKLLVNGASGAVGTAVVQLARHLDATVTAVCSGGNAALVRSLGADHVIDYTREDFTTNGQRYDVIVDTAGTAGYQRSARSLTERGRFVPILGSAGDLIRAPWVSLTSRRQVVAGPAPMGADDLRLLADLARAGAYRAVIDRTYSLEQIVDAHRYVETGRKRGSVVITV